MENFLSAPSFPLVREVSETLEGLLPEGIRRPLDLEERPLPTWEALCAPLQGVLPQIALLESRSNHPLEFTFSEQVFTLVYFHVEEYPSARALLEDLQDPRPPLPEGLPSGGVAKSTFFDALQSRGLPQMMDVFDRLSRKAAKAVGMKHEALGELRALDGSLIEATLSMEWADYTQTTHKAKVHLSFDLNRGLPRKILLTDGKGPERPVVSGHLAPGETQVSDRGYQDHTQFDQLQEEGKFFVCRIRSNTQWTLVETLPIPPGSHIVFHAAVYLGDAQHRTRHPVRLVGVKVRRKILWIATNRTDLTATQIAWIYRLRWEIEKFFGWWKRYLKVYHLIARSPYGLFMQLLAGLITYLLLVIYFYQRYEERPSLSRLRQLRRDIRRERAALSTLSSPPDSRMLVLLTIIIAWNYFGRNTFLIAIL